VSEQLPKQDLLLKMLNMTTHENDNQALVAIRKANALLESAGWTWDKLLSGKITVVADPFSNLQRPEDRPRYAGGSSGGSNYTPPPPPPPQPVRAAWTPPPKTYKPTAGPMRKRAAKRAVNSLDDLGL
jgi:hypothetical protein